jgi:hypothetical protein
MPPSVRPEAAWTYISLGEDYVETKDWGGASRAYWAALELVSRTVASRPDRERVIRSAFEGLEKVAEARGQQKWAKLMKFSARLADTYLNSRQAAAENAEFYQQMQTIKEAQKGVEKAHQDAKSQLWNGLVSVVQAGLQAANAAQYGDSSSTMDYATKGITQLVDTGTKYNQAIEAINALNKKFSEKYEHLRAAVADDVEAIEAGNSFVANGVLFYLDNAADPAPYIKLINSFAKNKPQLRALLAPYEDPSELELSKAFKEELKGTLVQVEKFVALYERRGLEAPMQIAKTVWADADEQHAAREPLPVKEASRKR